MTERITEDDILLREMESADTPDIVRWRNSDAVRKNFIDHISTLLFLTCHKHT